MIDIAVLLVASVALQGATGVVAAPEFLPPAVVQSVTLAPAADDFMAPFYVNGGSALTGHQVRVDQTLLTQLGGSALLDQLAMLDPTELEQFVADNADAVAALVLDPPAAAKTANWWNSLNAHTRSGLSSAAPQIVGNLPGVPFAVRDSVNRQVLEDTISELEDAASATVGRDPDPTISSHLNMLRQVEIALEAHSDEPQRSILSLDTTLPGRAAVAVGDPVTADYVSYLVPGMFFTIEGQVVDWAQTAQELYNEQSDWLGLLGQTDSEFRGQTVATVAWMGYETPNLFTVTSQELADLGALYLDSAMDALLAETADDRPFVSLIAHSYGSTAAMTALSTGNFEVDSFAVVGSPGSAARSVDDLSVRGRNVFVGRASWDPVATSAYFGSDPGSPAFGAHAMSVAGGVDLITEDPLGASVGHNDYFAPNSESLRNMALIGINRGSLVSDGSGQDVQRTLAYFDRLI